MKPRRNVLTTTNMNFSPEYDTQLKTSRIVAYQQVTENTLFKLLQY